MQNTEKIKIWASAFALLLLFVGVLFSMNSSRLTELFKGVAQPTDYTTLMISETPDATPASFNPQQCDTSTPPVCETTMLSYKLARNVTDFSIIVKKINADGSLTVGADAVEIPVLSTIGTTNANTDTDGDGTINPSREAWNGMTADTVPIHVPAGIYQFFFNANTETEVAGPTVTVTAPATAPMPPPLIADTTPPAAPTNLTASAENISQINLAWTAAMDNTAVTGYKIERCNGADCEAIPANFAEIGTAAAGAISFEDTGLTDSTSYSYRIRALDAAGNESDYSDKSAAQTADYALTIDQFETADPAPKPGDNHVAVGGFIFTNKSAALPTDFTSISIKINDEFPVTDIENLKLVLGTREFAGTPDAANPKIINWANPAIPASTATGALTVTRRATPPTFPFPTLGTTASGTETARFIFIADIARTAVRKNLRLDLAKLEFNFSNNPGVLKNPDNPDGTAGTAINLATAVFHGDQIALGEANTNYIRLDRAAGTFANPKSGEQNAVIAKFTVRNYSAANISIPQYIFRLNNEFPLDKISNPKLSKKIGAAPAVEADLTITDERTWTSPADNDFIITPKPANAAYSELTLTLKANIGDFERGAHPLHIELTGATITAFDGGLTEIETQDSAGAEFAFDETHFIAGHALAVEAPKLKISAEMPEGQSNVLAADNTNPQVIKPVSIRMENTKPQPVTLKHLTLEFSGGNFPQNQLATEIYVWNEAVAGTGEVSKPLSRDDVTVSKRPENGYIILEFGGLAINTKKRITVYAKTLIKEADAGKKIQYRVSSAVTEPEIEVEYANGTFAAGPELSLPTTQQQTDNGGGTGGTGSTANLPSIVFSTSSPTINAGDSATLSWIVTNAANAAIDQSIGGIGLTGSHIVTPSANTTYTLTAFNAAGQTATKTVAVSVVQPVVNAQTTCPAGQTGTPPNCTSVCVSPLLWDTTTNTCKQPSTTPAPSPTPTPPPAATTCESQGKYTYTGDPKPGMRFVGMCIECPMAQYQANNYTCRTPAEIAAGAGGANNGSGSSLGLTGGDTEAASGAASGGALAGGAAGAGAATGAIADTDAFGRPVASGETFLNTNLLGPGYSVYGDPNLGGSTRLVRAPDRSGTGPAAGIYFAIFAAVQAGLYLRKKLRK